MMLEQNFKKMIDEAMSTGQATYQAWQVDFVDNELIIAHNGGNCARFIIQGWQKGELIYSGICTATERPILDEITLYMLGVEN
ncbi:hypothetical protein [Lactococcus taiwanensis]|nr:hypothetical protein [Lactococcus taiwanensis]QRZ10885.1 hypothetical protein JVB21_09055 [Lactococcus taiwanensis]